MAGAHTGSHNEGVAADGVSRWPARIALLHLDSLCCLPALDRLFIELGGRVGLVVGSSRFKDRAGFWRQLRRQLSLTGVPMTLALGFDIVALHIAALFAPALRRLGRRSPLLTLREHARRVNAKFVVAADINGPDALAVLRQYDPDLIVSLHFDQILSSRFIQALPKPVVNIHPALLPAHRGPCPAFWSLAAADPISGVTVHLILDGSIDTGPPVAKRAIAVPSGLCMGELDEKLFSEGVEALLEWIAAEMPKAPASLQDSGSDGGAYETFPDRRTVANARRHGVKLWRFTHSVRLIAALFGWRRP
jgi:methionyl-tRNA formyltransferase